LKKTFLTAAFLSSFRTHMLLKGHILPLRRFSNEGMIKMPAFIGAVQIVNVSGTAGVTFGDTAFLSPKTASKTSNGAGGGNGSAFVNTNNGVSSNNVIDTSVAEQPITGNN
jgi:spore germination protein PF